MKLLLLPLFVLLLLPSFVFSQTPPNLDCADIRNTKEEATYKAAVFDLTPCDNSYKFPDLQNKTARQISLAEITKQCAGPPTGKLVSSGSNIYECQYSKAVGTTPITQNTAPQSASGGKVYSPLVNIPGNGANGFEQYISFLYGASISIAALLAVVKIIIAGAKYMLSDVITNKGEAIKDIQGAILGLLLILGAVIILEFINPQLIKGNIQFQTIPDSPKINARQSALEASKQQATDLTANLPSCVVIKDNGVGGSGFTTGTTVDFGTCPSADWTSIATQFGKNCGTKKGTLDSRGTILSCSIVLATGGGLEYKGSEITASKYKIASTSVTTLGNTREVDVSGQCKKQVESTGGSGALKQNVFNGCVTTLKENVREYCEDDNGGNYSSAETTASCTLPVRRAFLSNLSKELEQYKANLSDTNFVGKGITNANDAPEEVRKEICKIWGGEYRNIDAGENICVSFTPKS